MVARVSHNANDKTGANLPSKSDPWLLRGNLLDVELGEDAGPALLEVSEHGYCLLREER